VRMKQGMKLSKTFMESDRNFDTDVRRATLKSNLEVNNAVGEGGFM
jgi:hypothetical protein